METVIEKGKRAAQVAADPLVNEAIQNVIAEQMTKIRSSAPADHEKREQAYFLIKATEEFQLQLNKLVGKGKLEEVKRGARGGKA